MKTPLSISFVIPAKNEEKTVKILAKQIETEMNSITKKYEIIFIDDGSTDSTYKEMSDLHRKNKKIKIIHHRGNWGKSIALQNGFNLASGGLVFTMDADLQDDPKEIPHFIKKINEGFDLVSGWKKKRFDSKARVIPSRILNNFLIPLLTGVRIHDTNCGFKLYKKEVIKNLNLYGELYRYIPIIAAKDNFRITEIEIKHKERKFGKSKFGWSKNIKGFIDLITIFFLTGYLKRPAHFFGTLGMISFSFGMLIGIYITYLRITTGGINYHQPLLIFGILLIIVGIQLITTGLIAEMLVNLSQVKTSSEKSIATTID